VQQVQDLLRDAIVRLELPPGAEIDKVALCSRLGVSRFPVSEALGRLATEGFVEVLPQRGTRVARIDLADCEQAMFIRRALETEAVRAVAVSAGEQLLVTVSSNLRKQRRAMRADDRAAFHELDLVFHSVLLDALGFERVKHVVDAARANLDRARLFLCTPERQPATFAEHACIAAALRARDGERASQAMEAHLDAVMDELMTFAAAHPDMVAAQTNNSPSESGADAAQRC
jgi:GntR family transcriptional regulator, rspAB operon transcriptional repressor